MPTKAVREFLDSLRGPGVCEFCQCPVSNREAAHIVGRGMGGGRVINHPLNLVSLCSVFSGGRNCHHESHKGRSPTTEELWAVVADRENVPVDTIKDEINRLRKLKRKEVDAEIEAFLKARREAVKP